MFWLWGALFECAFVLMVLFRRHVVDSTGLSFEPPVAQVRRRLVPLAEAVIVSGGGLNFVGGRVRGGWMWLLARCAANVGGARSSRVPHALRHARGHAPGR